MKVTTGLDAKAVPTYTVEACRLSIFVSRTHFDFLSESAAAIHALSANLFLQLERKLAVKMLVMFRKTRKSSLKFLRL